MSAHQEKKLAKQSRIQTTNRAAIMQAALDVFSTDGYRGATIDRIAEYSGLSKTGLLYYYPSKEEIYRTVLEHTVENWLKPFEDIDPAGDPVAELRRYIAIKLQMSAEMPQASRLFANEIQRGAPLMLNFLRTRLRSLVDEKAKVIRSWIDAGKIAPLDPYHLIFMIWAVTQHYADFEVQVSAVLGDKAKKPGFRRQTADAVTSIIFEGIMPR